MIRSALIDWSESPVITSLESISSPIDNIQFPTITVCKDETTEQPDNWAYLEKVLNTLSFSCDYPTIEIHFNDCPFSEKLRHDFDFLIEEVVNVFDKWIQKNYKSFQGIEHLLKHSTGKLVEKFN